jgi:hypothetical protein
MLRLERAVVWQRLDRPGSEYCELWEAESGWELRGTVVLVDRGAPLLVRYAVACDATWSTRTVQVELTAGALSHALSLHVDESGQWWRNSEEIAALRGCVDVDLAFTPSTNTLPIRRLSLPVDASTDVTAAWVRLPDLSLETLPQRYTRLAADRYRYESRGGEFTAELQTDDQGIVTTYPGIWARAAATGD